MINLESRIYIYIHMQWIKLNFDLCWIIKNVIIYCEYTLKLLVFEVIYFTFL